MAGLNTSDVSLETYLQLGSNSIVRLHSLLIASRLNRMMRLNAADAGTKDDDDDGELIRSSLLTALSTLPMRDVVRSTDYTCRRCCKIIVKFVLIKWQWIVCFGFVLHSNYGP